LPAVVVKCGLIGPTEVIKWCWDESEPLFGDLPMSWNAALLNRHETLAHGTQKLGPPMNTLLICASTPSGHLRTAGLAGVLCMALIGCGCMEKSLDQADMKATGVMDEDLERAVEWSNVILTKEQAFQYIKTGQLSTDVIRISKDAQTFRDNWRRQQTSYGFWSYQYDIVADARWSRPFQWKVIWRCLVVLFAYTIVGPLLLLIRDRYRNATGAASGCIGSILTLLLALPAFYYLIKGIL
jgi:hypothetical protein